MAVSAHPVKEAADKWLKLISPYGGQVFPVVPDPHPGTMVVPNKAQREAGQEPPDHEGKRPSFWVAGEEGARIQPLAFNSASDSDWRRWWDSLRFSKRNTGVCLRMNGPLKCLDPDRKNVTEEEWTNIVTPWAMGLKDQGYYVEKSGSGGFHIIGLLPEDDKSFASEFTLPGLDGKKLGEIKQNGGIVVVAPTKRAGGGEYEQLSDLALKTFPPFMECGCEYYLGYLSDGTTYQDNASGSFLSQAAARAIRAVPTGEPTEPDWWDLTDQQKAQCCVKYLPRDQEYGRGQWVKIGGALWNVFRGSDEGLKLFTIFSRETPGFISDDDVEQNYHGFAKAPSGERAGVGALKIWAELGGLIIPPKDSGSNKTTLADKKAANDIRQTISLEQRQTLFQEGVLKIYAKERNVLRRKVAVRSLKDELGLQVRDHEVDSVLRQARQVINGDNTLKLIPAQDLPVDFQCDADIWTVPRLALRGNVSQLVGEPKSSKTKFCMYAIRQALMGGDFLGEKCGHVDKVLLLISDQPQNRTEAYLQEQGIRRHPQLIISPNFSMTEEHLDEVYALMDKSHQNGEHLWIVLDSLTSVTRATGIDENSTDVGEIIYDWSDVVSKYNHTSTVIHHMSKNADTGSVNAGRGSSSLSAAFSVIVNMSRPKKKNEFSGDTVSDARTPQRRLAAFSRAAISSPDIRIEILPDNTWRVVGEEEVVAAAQHGSAESSNRSSGQLPIEHAQVLVALVDDRAAEMAEEEGIWGGMRVSDLAIAVGVTPRPEGGWEDSEVGDKQKRAFDAWRKRLTRWMEKGSCPIHNMAGGRFKGADRLIGLNGKCTDGVIAEAREVVALMEDEDGQECAEFDEDLKECQLGEEAA